MSGGLKMYTNTQIALLRKADGDANLPGVDTAVGNLAGTTKFNATVTIPYKVGAPFYYNAATKEVIVTQNGAVLSGYDFSGLNVLIMANDVTIKNCTFNAAGNYAVKQFKGYSGATVENCTFDNSARVLSNLNAYVSSLGAGNISVLNNKFINAPGDVVDISGGVVSGNYISGAGFSSNGSHPDAVWVTDSTGPTLITDNFIDFTYAPGATNVTNGLTNNAIRITSELGNVSNVTVTGNYLLGGATTIDAGNEGSGTFSNISITNNYIGFGVYGDFLAGPEKGVTLSGNVIYDLTNPTNSSAAWSAYSVKGLATDHLLVATNATSNFLASTTGSTTLYGNGVTGAHLDGSTNALTENVFVGGSGSQYFRGGAGKNVYTYLALADSTPNALYGLDLIGNFDLSKDVIDLHRINANPLSATTQNFTFIGSNAFSSAGGEVRVVLDPATNQTLVEADMVGDTSPDLEIRLSGLLNLTASNFVLTAAQAAAALPTQTKTVNGDGSYDIAYGNYVGLASTSYEDVFNAAGTRVAESVDNANGSGSLVLSGDGQTVTAGAGALSTTVGRDTFALTPHASETITATGTSGDAFVFHQGFGQDTLNGFVATGSTHETLQFDTSMFSYLNASMTQAQDLAAVISHATQTAAGAAIIQDSFGDKLTVAAVSNLTLSRQLADFHFK